MLEQGINMKLKCPYCFNAYTSKECGFTPATSLQATIVCRCGKCFDVSVKRGWFKNKVKIRRRV